MLSRTFPQKFAQVTRGEYLLCSNYIIGTGIQQQLNPRRNRIICSMRNSTVTIGICYESFPKHTVGSGVDVTMHSYWQNLLRRKINFGPGHAWRIASN